MNEGMGIENTDRKTAQSTLKRMSQTYTQTYRQTDIRKKNNNRRIDRQRQTTGLTYIPTNARPFLKYT